MSEPRTPPLTAELVSKKDRRKAKAKRQRSPSTDSSSSTSSSSVDYKRTKSRKNRRSTSSSSSAPTRSSRSKQGARKKKRKHRSARNKSRESGEPESKILKQLVMAIDKRNRSPDVRGSQNVIPEFDPQSNVQTMKDWLSKINELAHVYGWSQKQIVYYALPKLRGLAKSWHDGLQTVDYTWEQWQEKLLEIFPDEENYADLLTDMLARKTKRNELLEEYYFDKMRLVHRCEITGRKAVDCLTHGIYDNNTRNNAKGFSFKQPEEVLTYFRKVSTKRENFEKNIGGFRERNQSVFQKRPQNLEERKRLDAVTCHNCGNKGHYWKVCPKEIVRCVKCKKIGHHASKCETTPLTSDKSHAFSNASKNVNKIESTAVPCDKYIKDILVNAQKLKGFIDLGSECTLISDQVELAAEIVGDEEMPILKGFGNSLIKPSTRVKIQVQVDNITENIDAYTVPNSMLPYETSILIGQNLTELPNVRVYKTDNELMLFKAMDKPIPIEVKESVEIRGSTVVPVLAAEDVDCASLYINSEICLKPESEYIILPGVYKFDKGVANIVILGLATTIIKLRKGQLIARGLMIPEFMLSQLEVTEDHVKGLGVIKNVCSIIDSGDKKIRLEDINTDQDLRVEQKEELCTLLNENRDVFAFSTAELGKTNLTELHIKLKDDTPVTYRPYRLSNHEREKVKSMIEDLCANGVIRESESEYASPIIVVPKKNGEVRLCIDYRALNKKTHKDKYPMPRIDDQIDSLCGQNFFTTLDLTSGYHQIPIAEESKHVTAFITPDGHFEYNRMPFGLCNAPAVFQRLIHKVLNTAKIPGVLAYMDDIVISSKTIEEGKTRLLRVLQALREANLTLNLSKCHFFKTSIEYLGYEISMQGVKPGQKKIEAVASFKTPQNVHEVRQFIGLASFFRRFVPGFAKLAQPMTRLTRANEKWCWEEEQERAFASIKEILISRPVLAIYDPSLLTELHTDASQLGIGGMLMQRPDSKSPLRAVAYFSRQTTAEEQHFHSFELETLAVVMSLNRFRHYLIGIEFKVVTDCNAVRLTWTKRDIVPRIARWWLQAQEFNFTIEYRPGLQMMHVDALSRNPVEAPGICDDANNLTYNVLKISTKSKNLDDIQYTDPQLVLIKCILNSACNEAKELRNNYVLKDGKVYKRISDSLKWVVPQDARWKVCHMSHDECGHMGIEKTLDKIKQTYWFPHMTSFVKKYVRACIPCAYAKLPTGKKEGFLHPIPKTPVPFHSVHIDHLGPFIKSKTGNTYILGIIDGYSKFIILKAVRNTKSKTSIAALREVFGIFGAPKLLISDRGTSFTSAEFAQFAQELEFKHIKNAVAMPRANGQIERYNRSILASLVALMHDESDQNWDSHLNTVQWSLNNTLNKGIGKTPSEVVFGKRTIQLSEGHLHEVALDSTQSKESMIDQIRSEVTETIEGNQAEMEKRFNEKRRVAKLYKEGDLVLVQKQLNNPGESNKLLPRYSGPYKVTKVLGLDRYEVSSIDGYSKRKYCNVYASDKMKPWISFTSSETDNTANSNIELDKDILPEYILSDDEDSNSD